MKLATHGVLVGMASLKDLSGRMVVNQTAAVRESFSVEDSLLWITKVKHGQYLGTAIFVAVFILSSYLFFGLHQDGLGVATFILGFFVPFFGTAIYINHKGKNPEFFDELTV